MARRLALASAVAVVLAVFSFTLYGYWISEQARFMLRTAQEFSEQETQPTVDEIRQRFGARLQVDYCGADSCSYKVTVSNQIVAALHLVPYTELQSNFWVRNGLVYENLLDYMTTVRDRKNVTAHAAVQFEKGCVFSLDPWEDSSPTNSNGLADIAPDCPSAEKQVVLDLNIACLTKLGGCGTIADLIPTMWKHNADGTIRCRIPSCEGFVHPPASWTWMKWKGGCRVVADAAHPTKNVPTRR
jgi:hypothetical protein